MILDGCTVHCLTDNHPVHFTRRRYGKKVFTWVSYHNGKEWIDLGDPWPSPNPHDVQLKEEIQKKEGKWQRIASKSES